MTRKEQLEKAQKEAQERAKAAGKELAKIRRQETRKAKQEAQAKAQAEAMAFHAQYREFVEMAKKLTVTTTRADETKQSRTVHQWIMDEIEAKKGGK